MYLFGCSEGLVDIAHHRIFGAVGSQPLADKSGVDHRHRNVCVQIGSSGVRVGGDRLAVFILFVEVKVGGLHGLHGGDQPRVAGEVDLDLRDCCRQQVCDVAHLIPQIGKPSPIRISIHRRIYRHIDAAVGHP